MASFDGGGSHRNHDGWSPRSKAEAQERWSMGCDLCCNCARRSVGGDEMNANGTLNTTASNRLRVELAVLRFHERNGIYPTTLDVASNLGMTVLMVKRIAEKSEMISLTWSGPRPPDSKIILEATHGK